MQDMGLSKCRESGIEGTNEKHFVLGFGNLTEAEYEKIKREQEFMGNPDNSHNCSECPDNREFSDWPGTRLPCGQFHCNVEIYCQGEKG